MFKCFIEAAKEQGLKINGAKTKYIITSKSTAKGSDTLNIDIDKTYRVKYLGSIITEKKENMEDMTRK